MRDTPTAEVSRAPAAPRDAKEDFEPFVLAEAGDYAFIVFDTCISAAMAALTCGLACMRAR